MKSSPCLSQLEKSLCSIEDPAQPPSPPHQKKKEHIYLTLHEAHAGRGLPGKAFESGTGWMRQPLHFGLWDCWVTSWDLLSSVLYDGEGNGTPLQYSCLENPMDGGAWWAAVHGVAKTRAQLSDFPFTFHFHALEKEMATHCSVLAWRVPGTGEPGGLPSLGSHRVGHDWSDLAAVAVAVLCDRALLMGVL